MPDLFFEKNLVESGYKYVAGVDEAGRGPLAGPVVAAAVILPEEFSSNQLNDSKKLSSSKREKIYNELMNVDSKVISAFAVIDEVVIDKINILRATHMAMAQASSNLSIEPSFVIIDGMPIKDFPFNNESIIKGDSKSLSIAAASVIAKVERDRIMLNYSKEYPEYKFEKHKGYGTKLHLDALKKFGPCKIHRKSFAPVKKFL
ncbi:MAG: ribonuclease HII [Verrucomicrobiales bacterium]|jgi:ribonuclease HII|nr:ribonuclease HII [Verrucomicrobiales bacterium]|tara:strand:- start:275 stop:883 length:609 start_codon:yes stop_codon:yes gene_type:complete